MLGDVEVHAVGVLELALEVAGALVAEVEENLPPAASIRFCVSTRSSTWMPKWCAPTKVEPSFRSEAAVPPLPVKLSSAMLMTP